MVTRGWFDNVVLLFIALNCITLAMERPNIPPDSKERAFLSTANYVFTVVFAIEMFIKVNISFFISSLLPIRFFLNFHEFILGRFVWNVLRTGCIFYFWLEYHGRFLSNNFHNRFVNVPGIRFQPTNFRNTSGKCL